MNISNQNNGFMRKNLHRKSTGTKGVVAALACRVAHILSCGGTEENLLCDYFQTNTWEALQSYDIVSAIQGAPKTFKLQEQGIEPDLIG